MKEYKCIDFGKAREEAVHCAYIEHKKGNKKLADAYMNYAVHLNNLKYNLLKINHEKIN